MDDILIGLDMTNRVKMFDLVHEHFSDWQILLFTYSKAWFERLKDRVKEKIAFPDWSAHWQSVVLWEEWRDEENSPRIVADGSGDLLEMAERHLKRKDYTAAAVYARKALESVCHIACAKASLSVLHVEFPKRRKVEHFLAALTSRLKEIVDNARRARALTLLTRLDHARAFVLNRNAHFDVEEEDILSAEVDTAIDVVSDLRTFFTEQVWNRQNFHSERKFTPLEQMNAQLATARALVAKGAIRSCQAAMNLAHHFFWQVFGSKLGVLLPLGVEPKAPAIWKASEEQGKLQTASQTRLEAVKGYLFGSVKGNEFDAAKFEQAANLLEYLVNDHRELSLIHDHRVL